MIPHNPDSNCLMQQGTEDDERISEADAFYARGYGLRCMVVDFLNGAIDRDGLRRRFTDWEYGCSGTKFSISPAQRAEWSSRSHSPSDFAEELKRRERQAP